MSRAPQIGDRVRIVSIDRTGVICFIDWPDMFKAHDSGTYPIQVALDAPYNDGLVWRTHHSEIEREEVAGP